MKLSQFLTGVLFSEKETNKLIHISLEKKKLYGQNNIMDSIINIISCFIPTIGKKIN